MARLKKIEPGEAAGGFADTARVAPLPTNGDTPQPEPAAIAPTLLSFDLAKGKGKAIFRPPTALDLDRAEQGGGSFTNAEGIMKICRELAEITCTGWGSLPTMPEPSKIRRQDSDRCDKFFLDLLKPAYEATSVQDILAYCQVIDGGSTRDDGFDAYEVVLTGGDRLLFDEPTQADSDKKQRAKTTTSGMWLFAANLCRRWGDEAIALQGSFTVLDAIERVKRLNLDDFLRISAVLNSFRD